jgi:hypothetical protein
MTGLASNARATIFMIVAVAEEAVERRYVCAPRERDRDVVRAPRS